MRHNFLLRTAVLILSLTIVLSFGSYGFAEDDITEIQPGDAVTPEVTEAVSPPEPEVPDPDISRLNYPRSASDEMVLMLTGDLMCDYKYQNAVYDSKTKKYNFDDTFKYVKILFKRADYVVGNLEGNFSSSYPLSVSRPRYKGKPYLNGPSSYLTALKRAGFDGLVMANNHNCDTNLKGLKETVRAVDRAGFRRTGAYASKKDRHYFVLNKNGIKVAFLSYATYFNGLEKSIAAKSRNVFLSRYSPSKAKKEIKKAKKAGANYVIVYIHAGREYTPNITGTQKKIIKSLAKSGADFIIGSHPHVLQRTGYVKVGKRKVNFVYSMGNFTGKLVRTSTRETAILKITLKKNSSGKVSLKSRQYIPCYMKDSSREGKMVLIPEGYRTRDAALQNELNQHFKNIKNLLKA